MTLSAARPADGSTNWSAWATAIDAAARSSAFLDVEGKFGGGWSGLQSAITEAESSGGPSALVMMGKGIYDATSTINITKPFTLAGAGIRGTRMRHSGAFTGPLIRCENLKRSGEWESTVGSGPIQTYDEDDDNGGLTMRDFSIVDDNRSTANRHGIYLLDVDDLLMDNIQFGFLTGTALKIGADESDSGISAIASGRVRESDFRRIRIYRCGSGSPSGTPDVPALIIQNASSTGDGTNQNYFHQLRFVYNEGRMLLRGPCYEGNSLRRTIFRDTQLHALADNSNWSPVQYFPFDLVEINGGVRETLFDGVMVNGNRAGTACWAMTEHPSDSSSSRQPKRLVLRNINAVNIHGSLVRVEEGDSVFMDGYGLGSADEYTIDVTANASSFLKASVHEMGINQVGSGNVRNLSGGGSIERIYHGVVA